MYNCNENNDEIVKSQSFKIIITTKRSVIGSNNMKDTCITSTKIDFQPTMA